MKDIRMAQQLNPYVINVVLRESGERLPLLCRRHSREPLYYPSCYAVAEVRGKGHASATIEQALRSVMVFYLVLDRLKINLINRLDDGEVLQQWELEEVLRQSRQTLRQLCLQADHGEATADVVKPTAARRSVDGDMSVARKSYQIRLFYIRNYLEWLIPNWIGRMRRARSPLAGPLELSMKRVSTMIQKKIPSRASRRGISNREGLSKKARARLLQVIELDAPDNPWTNSHAKMRNSIMIRLLLELGCRRGELLGLRVQDIDFNTGWVRIVRKADDKTDPRRQQPLAKTLDREVVVGQDLVAQLKQYLLTYRNTFDGARKHGFLFVATGTGAPLSLDGLVKVFAALRKTCPDLPSDLSPHVLRHTWNDDFSEQADQAKLAPEEEARIRNYLMGWRQHSTSSKTYLRRHTREAAGNALLRMQSKLTGGKVK